jgi:hypothetical protein
MVGRLVGLSIGLATAFLVAGYALGGRSIGVLPLLALAALWFAGRYRGWRWIDTAAWLGYSGAAAAGMGMGLGAGWMLGGLVAALSAWDLAAFADWLQGVQPADKAKALLRRHLGQLLIVDAVGLLLAGVALYVRLRLSLALLLLLGLVLILGVSRAVSFLRREP